MRDRGPHVTRAETAPHIARLTNVRSLRVCDVAAVDSPAAHALYSLASDGRQVWTLADWDALLCDLDLDSAPVGEWLTSRGFGSI
jgi:hypothetical protein